MKLWDSLTTCLILLSAVHAGSLLRSRQQPQSAERRGRAAESPLELPPVQIRLSVTSPGIGRAQADTEDWEGTLAGGETCKSLWLYGIHKVPENIRKCYFIIIIKTNNFHVSN